MDHFNTRVHPGTWLAVAWSCVLAMLFLSPAVAQTDSDLKVKIPIHKDRRPYDYTTENGDGRVCGVRLYGVFDVYRNYTNLSDYSSWRAALVGIQNPSSPSLVIDGERKYFQVYCYFNGRSGPNRNANCDFTIGTSLPDWEIVLTRKRPRASFTKSFSPTPGEVKFQSTSIDYEDTGLVNAWDFGDGASGTPDGIVHLYSKPGSYPVTLRVTSLAGLSATNTQTVVIPAPQLETSLRLPDNRPGDTRVEIGKNFKVQLRVGASKDGVGALQNTHFTTAPVLKVPDWISVIEAPSSTEIGRLNPGDAKPFEWTLRANDVGKFVLVGSSLEATDAAGRTVSRSGALLSGSVPGLTVEVVFPEEPVRLARKPQPADTELSETPGYVAQAFPVILRVSVPEMGRPVKDVRLRNADANDGGLDIDRVKRTANPEIPWVQAVPQPVPFPITVTNKASPALIPGVMSPGDKPVDFKVMVQTDLPGDFSFTGIITALREDGTGEVTEVGSDVMSIGGDVLLAVQVELVHPLELPRITEGESVEVWGKIKNMTWDDTIQMHPVRVLSVGQGLVLGPAPQDGTLPPVGIPGIFDPVLKPREERAFRARIKTEMIPGLDARLLGRTNVLVDFAVGGVLVKDGQEPRDLEPADVLVEWGKGRHRPGDGTTLLRARVDADPHDAQLLTAEQFFSISAGKAMENLAYGAKDAVMVSIPQTLVGILPTAWGVLDLAGAATVESYVAVNNAGRYLWAWLDWQTDVYLDLESETRRQQYQLIADELFYYYRDKFDSVEQVQTIVNRGIEGYFTKVLDYKDRAYEASNYGFNEELAGVVGEPFRAVGQVVTEEIVSAAAVQTFIAGLTRSRVLLDEAVAAKAARARRAEEEVAEATAEVARRGDFGDPRLVQATPGMRKLPGGTRVTPGQAIAGWAIDKVSDQNLRRMTDAKNGGMAIIVAIRSRADETIEWMQTSLGVVPKPVSFKPKNVDPDDVGFLGYRDGVGYGDVNGVGAGDRGATVIAEPFTREEVLTRLDLLNADARTRTRVLERHNKRWKEWHGADWPDKNPAKSAVEQLKAKTPIVEVVDGRVIRKGRLEVPRRGTTPDSSINMDTAGIVTMDQRRFEMRQVKNPPGSAEFPDGREYYETWLEDDKGVMRRIAGDIDVVAVTDASGHALPVASPFTETVAQNLQHGIQAQHPWSSSLRPEDMRKEFLDPHRWHPDPAKRGEPLLVYVNGEARVGWFHPSRTITAENPLAGFMWLDGGTGDVDDVVRFQRDMRGTLPEPADVAVPSFTPMKANVRGAMIDSDNQKGTTLLATCSIRTARAGGAVYRLGQAELLEKRREDGTWESTDPGAECNNGELVIVPDTALQEDVPSGAFRLPILEDLLGLNWKDLFRIGDQILIDPGSPTEEVRTVADHGSLILDRPLTYAHAMGTWIVLHKAREELGLPPPVAPPVQSRPLAWLRADAGLSLTNGTNVVSWTDQSENGFVFASRTEAARPMWVRDVTNGVPALRFDATKRHQLHGNLGVTLSKATIFTLMRLNPQSSTRYAYVFGTRNTSGYMMSLGRSSGGTAFHYDGAASSDSPGSWATTNWVVLSQTYGSAGPDHQRLNLNGRTVVDSRTSTGRPYTAGATNVVIGNYLSATYHFSGDLVEWIVYDRVLSDVERVQVEEYLRVRAGLPAFERTVERDVAGIGFHVGADDRTAVSWTQDPSTGVVRAEGGGVPSLVVQGHAALGERVRTQILPRGTNGAVGVFFGYDDRAHFHLLEWRAQAATNSGGQSVAAGLRLVEFHLPEGVEAPTARDFFTATNTANITVLHTNELPWVSGRKYDVVLRPTPGGLVIELADGDAPLVAWLLPDWQEPLGWFGHYSHGIESAEFGPVRVEPGVEETPVRMAIVPGDAPGEWRIQWSGGPGPFVVERRVDLTLGTWEELVTTDGFEVKVQAVAGETGFYRIRRVIVP